MLPLPGPAPFLAGGVVERPLEGALPVQEDAPTVGWLEKESERAASGHRRRRYERGVTRSFQTDPLPDLAAIHASSPGASPPFVRLAVHSSQVTAPRRDYGVPSQLPSTARVPGGRRSSPAMPKGWALVSGSSLVTRTLDGS